MKRILFVCSGNTCRSPLAEVIARATLKGMDGPDVRVSSAGTSTVDGLPASGNSAEIARRHGLDLSAHRSRLLTTSIVRESDLIVTMGARHRNTVGVIDPTALRYTRTLTSFSDGISGDIADPVGGDVLMYEQTYALIRDCVEDLARQLAGFDGWKAP